MKMSERKNEVPKLLSINNNRPADKRTGKEMTPMMAVTKKAHMVKGNLVMDMPLVRRFNTVTI